MKIREAVIVEGIYDKIKLQSIIDGVVVATNGFAIFSDKELEQYIISLAEKTGIVILTDSDYAGFLIRGHIKGITHTGKVLNAYIPDIEGKEKRKRKPSKEGFLGVEGISGEIIIEALKNAGATFDGKEASKIKTITLSDFYCDGLTGATDSKQKREALCTALGLPRRLSTHALLDALNTLWGYDKYKENVKG